MASSLRAIAALAAVALVVTTQPALARVASNPVAMSTSEPGVRHSLDRFSGRSTSAVPFDRTPQADTFGLEELSASATRVRDLDGPGVGKQPKLVRREASLWMSPNGTWPDDQQDLSSIDVVQDVSAKKVVVTAPYSATPTTARNTALFVWFGTWNADESSCSAKVQLAGVAASSSSGDAAVVDTDSNTVGTATRALSGSTLRLTWTGGQAGASSYGCVFASSRVVSATGEIATTDLEASDADDFDAEYEKAPEFDFYSSKLNAAQPGRWNRVYVNIRNDGDAPPTDVKLSGSGPKLTLRKKTVSLGTIQPGKSKSVNLQVKLKGRATRRLALKVASRGGWSSTSSTQVGFKPLPTKLKSLAGRSWWASESKPLSGWTVHGLTFTNKKWVHVGVPKSGIPNCSAKVKQCKRYSFAARTGTLKIGKLRAKVDSQSLRVTSAAKGFPKVTYAPLRNPKPGTRVAATLKYYDYSGCEGSYTCSSWWRFLTLRKNGTFRWTYEAIHSSGFPPNEVFVSVSGPHAEGTYQFLSRNRLRLSYVDEKTGQAKQEIRTVGIDSDVLMRFGVDKGLLVGSMPHSP